MRLKLSHETQKVAHTAALVVILIISTKALGACFHSQWKKHIMPLNADTKQVCFRKGETPAP